ncbi:hypothetical protein [Eoetvoesiella caeni]
MLFLYLAVLIIPTAVISVWDRLVMRFHGPSWAIYRVTGIIGTPIHELAHAAACLLFGMQITKISLYRGSATKGPLGFVQFSYRQTSVLHMLGRLIQAIAPLIVGGALAIWILGLYGQQLHTDTSINGLLYLIFNTAGSTLSALYNVATASATGVALSVLALVIALHAIPSRADVCIGLGGLFACMLTFGLIALGVSTLADQSNGQSFEFFGMRHIAQNTLPPLLAEWHVTLERGTTITLLWLIYGSVVVTTLALASSIVFIITPAILTKSLRRIRSNLAPLNDDQAPSP